MQRAFAQEARAREEGLSEVVVTGSRIVRRDYNSDSPIVTVSSDALTNTSEIGVEQSLNKMPQFVPGQNQFSDAGSITVTPRTSPGIATANLRGLGANRTLVLLDGRRTQPANASMVVDLNTIPSAAIDNVEIITGGAGSTYGADAVSGVVNFKLKRNFQGISTDAQFGMTERGDGEQTSVSALLGSNFAEGQGNAMIGLSYARREEVIREDVPFFEAALRSVSRRRAVPQLPGLHRRHPRQHHQLAGGRLADAGGDGHGLRRDRAMPAGDVLNTTAVYFNRAATTDAATLFALHSGPRLRPALAGLSGRRLPRRQVRRLERRTPAPGRSLDHHSPGGTLQVPLTRYSLFTNAHYEVTDNAEAYVQARFDENKTTTRFGDFVPAGNQWGVTDSLRHRRLRAVARRRTARHQRGLPHRRCLRPRTAGPTGGCTNSQAFPVPASWPGCWQQPHRRTPRPPSNANWTLNYNLTYMPRRGLENTQETYELLARPPRQAAASGTGPTTSSRAAATPRWLRATKASWTRRPTRR